jgi:hypothetical protein
MSVMSKPGILQHVTIGRNMRAVRIETAHLAVTVLLDQGADILELTDKQTGVDVLWKVPYATREPGIGPTPSGDSFAQWIHYYRGGWQTLLPNYGPAVSYRGAMLDFHGEAARKPWQLISERYDHGVAIEVATDLASLPLSVTRQIFLSEEEPRIQITESVTNLGVSCRLHVGTSPCIWSATAFAGVAAVHGSKVDPHRPWLRCAGK